MNRHIKLLCVIVVLSSLFGCQSRMPDKTSESVYKFGMAALETVDEYLDGIIDADTALERLGRAYDSSCYSIKSTEDSLDVETLVGTNYSNDMNISHNISMISHDLLFKDIGTSTTKEVVASRNNLAKSLNQKMR